MPNGVEGCDFSLMCKVAEEGQEKVCQVPRKHSIMRIIRIKRFGCRPDDPGQTVTASDPAAAVTEVEQLYTGHHRWLFAWLRSRLGCQEQAADLAHDTFVRILNTGAGAIRLREPRAYLATIARGLVVDLWRRRDLERAYLEALALMPEAEAPSAEHQLLVLEALQRVDAALQGLPPAVREVFLLSQVDGLSYPEIAERTGVAVITVKRYMQRAFLACLEAE